MVLVDLCSCKLAYSMTSGPLSYSDVRLEPNYLLHDGEFGGPILNT